ncbi:MAG TPA: NAD(P)-binding protein [Candidatus Solibacter sp.]|nr:NAD(P)-binding protein [Candidatus Solibacter sp.]
MPSSSASDRGTTRTRFALLGAGPTGIGAAWRLNRQVLSASYCACPNEEPAFLLIDQSSTPGGNASSVTTPEGFTFDFGGHVLYVHPEYRELHDLLDQVVPAWHSSTPIRGVWIDGRIIPTPVQRNIHRLPLPEMGACLWGLWRRPRNGHNGAEPSLQQLLEHQFGRALTRQVMAPLNQKMWAHSPEHLGSAWSSHRSGSKEKNIADVSVGGILRNWLLDRDQPGWTPATRVRYPLHGGSGSMWKKIFATVPEGNCRLRAKVSAIEATTRKIHFEDGSTVEYENLITSIPLDRLLQLLCDQPELQARSSSFRPARVQIFGFGIEGSAPTALRGVHALNVPAPDIPFWRVNFPSNFSPGNVPAPQTTWSILCEKSIAPDANLRSTAAEVESALRRMGLMTTGNRIVSEFAAEFDHGYPVPFAGRNELLNEIQPQLEQLNIFSRGRFGGWRYEVSNQDHSFMQGAEVVDRLLTGKSEYTYQKTW